jgi:type VI secretion system protein VasJ
MVAVKALQAFTTEVMGDLAPVWSGLGKALEDAQRRVPKEAPAPAQPGLPEDGAVAPPAEGRISSPSALSPASDLKNESDALEAIVGVAGFLREQTPANPISYRLDRVARWDAVVAEPSNEGGKTFLEDPATHRLTYMNSLVDSKDWKTLLQTAEDAFTESPLHFWLDLQRFVATALDGLGEEYEGAKQTVLLETAVLLKRVRSLSQLAFRSGTPFANPKTRFWLEDTVAPVLASDSGNASAVNDERLSEQIEAAKRLGADGKLSEAIGLLQDGLQQEGTRRGRFLRRLGMANVCMQASKPTIACPILESLEAEIDTLALNEWEPALALEVWSQLHQCYGLLLAGDSGSQEPTREKAQRVFGKICEIDASRALGS